MARPSAPPPWRRPNRASKPNRRSNRSSMNEERNKMNRVLIAALALGVTALVLAGCGGSSGGSSSEASTTASRSSSSGTPAEGEGGPGGRFEISEEAKACLKEKGVELPEFKGGEGGPPGGAEGEMPEPGEKPEGGEGG